MTWPCNSHLDCLTMEKFGLLSLLLLMLNASADELIPGLVKDLIYVEKNLSWYFARKYCNNLYGDLFSMSDENDLKNLSGSAKQLSWIGLYSWYPLWNWIDDTRANYFNWYEPGDCATINRNGFWYEMSCDKRSDLVCYRFPESLVVFIGGWPWTNCKRYCQDNYDGFPIIRNLNDNTDISASIQDFAWIGLTKVSEGPLKDTWQWVNGESLTYSNWYKPFFCAVMDWRGFWYDRVCFEEHQFVCFRKINSTEFMLVNENKIWSESQTHCKLYNMTLVMVKTQEEINALMGYIHGIYGSFVDDLYFWIGLYNDPWHWVNSNSKIRNWHSMQPDHKDFRNNPMEGFPSCVASMDGEWFDGPCTEPLPFFCLATVRSMILVSEPKSWEEALEHCRGTYVDLASLVSDEEQQVAQRKIKHVKNDYVWIGLRFLAGSWFWVYGDSLEYENWADGGQPQCPVPYRCGALNVTNGNWEARPCEERLDFLCFQK
ncbi:macrophage mannose receptor 1-like [Xyrauchen texanus]|uniref:macrophage mannose receptor 1-like n=1 Tax=Xyrauchen texanus TaxID=154827 RepID=UPI002242A830|nr:macrophage mannose receptor 1-like [Xyrauchen texanus]